MSGSTSSTPSSVDLSAMFGGTTGTAAASGAQSFDSSSSDLASSLRQSPFGRLLDIPGVTPASIFGNINPNDYASLGSNPFGSAALGTNPFTNYPGTTSLFSAATGGGSNSTASPVASVAASGSDPAASQSTNPAAAASSATDTSADTSGLGSAVTALAGQNASSVPTDGSSLDLQTIFGGASGGSGSNPFASGSSASLADSPFGPLVTLLGQDGLTYALSNGAAGSPSTGVDTTALLGQSSFAPLVNLIGADGVAAIFSGAGAASEGSSGSGYSWDYSALSSGASAVTNQGASAAMLPGYPTTPDVIVAGSSAFNPSLIPQA